MLSLSDSCCSILKGWIGVTSASPQKARIREKPDLKRLIGGMAMPWVCAAPRATFVQKPSTSLGVTRTSSTGGESATYDDQLPNSIRVRTTICCISVGVPVLPRSRWFIRAAWCWAPYVCTGVTNDTSKLDDEIW